MLALVVVSVCLLASVGAQSTGASYAPANTVVQTGTSGIVLSTNVTQGLAVAPAYVQVRVQARAAKHNNPRLPQCANWLERRLECTLAACL